MEMSFDEKVLHQLEQELNVEILPGTEIMTDVGTHHFLKSAGSSDRVLVPQPSADPHDPLNWSPLWKFLAITNALMSSFTQGFGPLAHAPMFGYYIQDFGHSLADVIQFTGVAILVLGFSNLFWIPMSSRYGRRVVLIASNIVCVGSNIWRAVATDYNSFMGASALNGFGAGPAETIGPAVIADLFFLHDRGKYNTGYFVTYFGSLMVGPIIAGPMAQAVGWRSFWWLNVAILAFNTITLVFLFPETKWHRQHPSELGHSSPAALQSDVSSTDKGHVSNGKVDEINDQPAEPMSQLAQSETAAQDPFLGRGKPSKAQFRLWQPADTHTNWFIELFTPWKLFAFPIVEYASFVVSWSASCFLTVNLTQAQNFAAPPYNFSSTVIGFFNFALLIGTFIGLATAGPLSDWVSMKLTTRNKGIREPEMRLPAMIPYVFIMILGNVINAVGYQNSWDWRIIVIIGYTCAGIQVAAIPGIASTYAVDSYKPVTGSIFVAITVNKNLWGYGFSKFITPWIISSGYIPPIMLNMALTTLWCSFGILFWFYGKSFRRWTKNDKVHSL